MDDPLHPSLRIGSDRDHIAAVTQRDDRFLERPTELGSDERVKAPSEPVVGDPDGAPKGPEPRRRGVQQLSGRVERPGERGPHRGEGMELAGEVPEERPAILGEGRPKPRRRLDRVGDLEELGRVEPATARRAVHGRGDVVRRADADARALLEQGPRLVGLIQTTCHDHKVCTREKCFRQPPARPERGQAGEPVANDRELEERDRPGVHGQRSCLGWWTAVEIEELPWSIRRQGNEVQGSPA